MALSLFADMLLVFFFGFVSRNRRRLSARASSSACSPTHTRCEPSAWPPTPPGSATSSLSPRSSFSSAPAAAKLTVCMAFAVVAGGKFSAAYQSCCHIRSPGFPGSIVCLDTPDTYPPQKKVFLMWKYLYENFRSEYNWLVRAGGRACRLLLNGFFFFFFSNRFMKVDHDSYLNVRELRSMLETLSTPKLLDSPQYIGWPATGRKDEQAKLGINGKTYCLGLGYLMNHQSME